METVKYGSEIDSPQRQDVVNFSPQIERRFILAIIVLSTCTFIGGLFDLRKEPYTVIATIVALLMMVIRSHTALGTWMPRCIRFPYLCILNVFLWTAHLMLTFVVESDLSKLAARVHRRVHIGGDLLAACWVVFGFFAGFEPGSVGTKLTLVSIAVVIVVVRLWALSKALSLESDPDGAWGWSSGRDDWQRCAHGHQSPRAIEVWYGGLKCLVAAPLLGMACGLVASEQSRLQMREAASAKQDLDEVTRNLSWMHQHAASLEDARREALIDRFAVKHRARARASVARRRSQPGAKSWQPQTASAWGASISEAEEQQEEEAL